MTRALFTKVPANFRPDLRRIEASWPAAGRFKESFRAWHIVSVGLEGAWDQPLMEKALDQWLASAPPLRMSLTPGQAVVCIREKLEGPIFLADRGGFDPNNLPSELLAPPPGGPYWRMVIDASERPQLYFLADARFYSAPSIALWLETLLDIYEGKTRAHDPNLAPTARPLFDRRALTSILPASSPRLLTWNWSKAAQAGLKAMPHLNADVWARLLQLQLRLLGESNEVLSDPLDPFSDAGKAAPYGRLFPAALFPFESTIAVLDDGQTAQIPTLPLSCVGLSLLESQPMHRDFHWHQLHFSALPVHFIFQSDPSAVQILSLTSKDLKLETLELWIGLFDALLAQLPAASSQPIAQLRFPDQAAVLQSQWNQTERLWNLESSIPELLAPSWERFSSKAAVLSRDLTLSYADIDRLSAQIALHLLSLGVQVGDRVGLALPRSPWLVPALLGVLRAGAAYVPLDPEFPRDRLAYMIADSGLKAWLSARSLLSICPEGVATLAFEDLPDLLSAYDPRDLKQPVQDSRALAYVIYTSGSTGQPKGVMLSHRSVVNFLLSMREQPGMEANDKMLAVTTLSFDIAVLELLLPLLVGAQVYLGSAEESRDGRRIKEILEREGITHFQATPSTYRLLLDAAWKGSRLKKALCGGEAFPADVARRLLPLVSEVWNMYGPTETTVWSTLHRLQGQDIQVPIGRPIANTTIHILNDALEPVLPGQKGEIYIGGEGLALGYLGRSDLTAERFITLGPDGKGSRVYRTGDLGRYTWSGQLEIFGRTDHQIKLRGFRMELGEIEAHVSRLSAVSHCVAAVQDFGADDLRLVAYITVEGKWDEKRARQEIKTSLPPYMLPQLYVVLDKFPLLPNGKIDRKQLPHPRQVPLPTPLAVSLPPAAENLAAAEAPAIPSLRLASPFSEKKAPIPLTPSQSRMLYVEQLDPGTSVHNLMGAWIIHGAFDLEAFRASIEALVLEQESLRCHIDYSTPEPTQRITEAFAIELPVAVMFQVPHSLPEIEQTIVEISRRRLDITRAPHFQVGLFRLQDGRSIFYLLSHHIFWDGFSYGVFWRRIQKFYQEHRKNQQIAVQQPRVNFSDYAIARVAEAQDPSMNEQLQYWKQRFDPLPDTLALATDWPRPAELRHEADTVWIPWDRTIEGKLQNLARERGSTLYHTLVAATFALLSRLSGQTDLVIGTPVHGRSQSEYFELLGNFINVAALRVSWKDNIPFSELIDRVKKATYEAQAHADLPFEHLIAALKLPRDQSRTPLYSAMVFYQDHSGQVIQLDSSHVEPLRLKSQTVDTDIVFWFERHAEQTYAGLNFRKDLWEKETMQAFALAFRCLLDRLAGEPGVDFRRFALLEPHIQAEVLQAGRQPITDEAPVKSLDRWLFNAARQYRNQIAVETLDGRQLSYAELEGAARRLGFYLAKKGVQRGSIVGVSLHRQADLIVSLWAILSLGAAYLPLDPSYPKERLRFMAADAGLDLIVTEMEFIDLFEEVQVTKVCLDRERIAIDSSPEHADVPLAAPDDLAYIIYTSGSTGQPKGVEIQHSAVVHFLHAMQDTLKLPAQLRTLAITTISFDISVLEIFLTLVRGGTIVLVDTQQGSDGGCLIEALAHKEINLLQATPAFWRLLLGSGWKGQQNLIALCGGEALRQDLAREIFARVGQLWNVYGPTEATVWATAERILDPEAPICIGRVLPAYEALILDESLHPLPFGAIGQLYLAGPALARGYRARPELTAERFRPHRFRPLERMYDTGDRARLRRDGRIEYMGRVDHQVKLRGFRIELGEIESFMSEHPAIAQSVCLIDEPIAGDQRLLAYVRLHAGSSLDLPTLHRHLLGRLPKYMLPNQLIVLEEMPLTGSGKIDRKRLPSPPAPQAMADVGPVQHLTLYETKVAAIFCQLLGLPHVRSSDNFFDLGGHSLLALRVLHRCQEDLGFTLKIRDLLLLNISQIAAMLEAAQGRRGAMRQGDRR